MKDETEPAPKPQAGGAKTTTAHDERLAQALRANLKRRKDQARGRTKSAGESEQDSGPC